MKHYSFRKAMLKPLVLGVLAITALVNVAKAGSDSYTIYLNGKLVMKQYVMQPLSIAGLPLDNAGGNDFFNIQAHSTQACGQFFQSLTPVQVLKTELLYKLPV